MFALSAIAVFSLMAASLQPPMGILALPQAVEQTIPAPLPIAHPSCSKADHKSGEASTGSGHLLREATVSPSIKFVMVRLRERSSHRDLFVQPISDATTSPYPTVRTCVVPRCAVLRI